MAFHPADVVGLLWSHPIVSVAVVLLFTPPLFPIVVYFSPLLISTALFVLAMISMGSDVGEGPSYSSDIPYKRGWIEEAVLDDGPALEGERLPKRLKASSRDESWFDKVKNWEGTGRAWVESVLTQESRRSVSSDDHVAPKEDAVPLLESAREFVIENKSRPSSEAPSESKPVGQTPAEQAPVTANESTPSIAVDTSKGADGQSRAVPDETLNNKSEITPALESEDELPVAIPPSPLFRGRSLPKADATGIVAAEGTKSQGVSSEDIKETESVSSVPGTDSKVELKKTPCDSNLTSENSRIAPVVGKDRAELPSTAVAERVLQQAEIVPAGDDVASPEKSQGVPGEAKLETKDVNSNAAADRDLAEKGQLSTESSSGKSDVPESKSAAELLAPMRQGKTYGLATTSAAVALSEKLNVPLEEFMSLLAGDEGTSNAANGGRSSGVKAASSSSETTTSQEEEWSSSDGEVSAPVKSVGGPSGERKEE